MVQILQQEQVIQQKQSFALVNVLLQSAIAQIMYLRQLLPRDCFERRDALMVEYEGECVFDKLRGNKNNARVDEKNPDLGGNLFKVLKRDSSNSGAATVLKWLDAILSSLFNRTLTGVEFYVYGDKAKPGNILEMYTFGFQYSEDGGHIDMALPNLKPMAKDGIVTSTVARSSLETFIRNLSDYDQFFPSLPSERCLMCRLLHPVAISPMQIPLGFNSASERTYAFPNDQHWCRDDRDFKPIDLGSYSVGLKILYTAPRNSGDFALTIKRCIPDNLTYTVQPSRQLAPLSQTTAATGSLIPAPALELQTNTSPSRPLSALLSRTNSDSDSLTPTQPLDLDTSQSRQWFAMQLLPGKTLEINAKRIIRNEVRPSSTVGKSIVQCQCGYCKKEGKMACCICCGTWQHYHCYGFVVHQPAENHHVCYRCLLDDSEQQRLDDLEELAKFRRALWVLYQETALTQKAFNQRYGSDASLLKGIVQRLKREGFIKYKGKTWSPVNTPEQTNMWHNNYSDPLTLVGHCYQEPEDVPNLGLQHENSNRPSKRARRS